MRKILRHPLPSPQLERQLLDRATSGDDNARDELVRLNGKLVWSIAQKYVGDGLDVDDLWQEGCIGLLHAIRKWSPKRTNRFSTYALWWIRAYIRCFAIERRSDIKTPRRAHDYAVRLERDPDGCSVSPAWREALQSSAHVVASIDDPDMAEALTDEGPAQDAVLARLVRDASCLDARERLIIEEMYLNGDESEDVTLESIAKQLGITKQRVEQIRTGALDKLRKRLGGRAR